MARRISKFPNIVDVKCTLSGTVLRHYCRNPTEQERAEYANKCVVRTGNDVVYQAGEMQQEYALKILEGFRHGDYEELVGGEWKDGEVVGGQWVPVGSYPGEENYREDWKEWFKENNSDVLAVIGRRLFDQSALAMAAPAAAPEQKGEQKDPS